MNLRIPIACCVVGAMFAASLAINAVVFSVSSGIFSRDLSTLQLAPVVTDAQIERIRNKPEGVLIIGLNKDMQDYSTKMVKVATSLDGILRKRLIDAIVGGALCFLLFSYVGFALWKHNNVEKT